MNDEEKYLFDLRGYIVVKNALSVEQIEDLSSRLEARRKMKEQRHFGSDRTSFGTDEGPAWSAPSLLEWGGTYIDLIDLPTIAPYLDALLGTGYRLDHDYINVVNAEHPSRLYLHGGGHLGAGGPRDVVGPSDGGQCYYHYNNGRFFNGLLTVAFELNDVSPSTGGFACVAGSHKVNFPLPSDWRVSKSQADIPECVDRVNADAGDAIIFTEACAHGTVPWEGGGERRTVFYKYCPHAVAWGPCYYNADHYGDLTENQRAILMPPSAYGPHSHTAPIWKRAQAEQAELARLRKEVAELKNGRESAQ
ncbi:MAG: mitomycin antibiotics/polyketide fumonisin biosynthesis protein [Gammaproteobacteria bacterium]|nr:mitomycin antibiotics/polyketide fumonisin biosynthesis protein [Gammaproteobacteria bacterium]